MIDRHLPFTVLALTSALYGCNSETSPPPPDVLLAPPPAGQGVQYQMVTKIGAGQEAQHCKFVQAPADGLSVNHDEVRYTTGSHHFLLYETSYTQIPTQKDDGTPVDTSGVFDCTSGPTDGWSVTRLVGGSQNGKGTSMLDFPPDVAMTIKPGTVLLMNAHYINTTPAPIEPEVRINLFTVSKAQVKQEGDLLFLYNPFIKVPAQSQGRARMRCKVQSDVTLTNFQSHMHARGVGYAAELSGTPLYTNSSWEDVPVKSFPGGLPLAAGSVIDYHCDYNNTEARDVYQGPSATDEMCMAIGSFYPADKATALCASDPANPTGTGDLGAEWVGNGSATCAATLGCIQSALSQKEKLAPLISCVDASDPAVSKEMSDAIRCIFVSQNPLTDCQAQISACSAK